MKGIKIIFAVTIVALLVVIGLGAPKIISKLIENNNPNTIKLEQDPVGGRSVVYFTTWSDAKMDTVDPSLLTHLNLAFIDLKKDGSLVIGNTKQYRKVQSLKNKNKNLKTLISVGGYTWSENFSTVAAKKKKRAVFAKSVADFVSKYGFDGVDIDWEFPVTGSDGTLNRQKDRENYTLLLQRTREELNKQGQRDEKRYLLTMAGGASASFVHNIEMKKVMKYVDFINVMTYDYHGHWETVTNHNAPLYLNSSDPTKLAKFSISHTIQNYLDAGAIPRKLNLGLASFGRSWIGVGKENQGLFQKGIVPKTEATLQYWDLAANYVDRNGYHRYLDTQSKVPYLYNGDRFITFDDADSIQTKLDFALEKRLGGAMLWEYAGDRNKVIQQEMAKAYLR